MFHQSKMGNLIVTLNRLESINKYPYFCIHHLCYCNANTENLSIMKDKPGIDSQVLC